MAIRWVARAWKDVVPGTISKCFRKAGVLDSGMDVVGRGTTEETDPFEDLDAESQLQDLISRAMPTDDNCISMNASMARNLYLYALTLHGDDSWDETFLQERLGNHHKSPTKKRVKMAKAKRFRFQKLKV